MVGLRSEADYIIGAPPFVHQAVRGTGLPRPDGKVFVLCSECDGLKANREGSQFREDSGLGGKRQPSPRPHRAIVSCVVGKTAVEYSADRRREDGELHCGVIFRGDRYSWLPGVGTVEPENCLPFRLGEWPQRPLQRCIARLETGVAQVGLHLGAGQVALAAAVADSLRCGRARPPEESDRGSEQRRPMFQAGTNGLPPTLIASKMHR